MLRTPWGDLSPSDQRRTMAEQYEILRGPLTRRRFLQGAAAGGAALALGPSLLKRAARGELAPARAAHLAFGADPRTGMVVSWGTGGDGGTQTLRVGPAGSGAWSAPIVAETRGVPRTPSRYHHAQVGGLDADTAYDYVVGDPSAPALSGSFTTAPDAARPFRFTAFGDQGVSANAAAVTQAVAAEAPEFHFHVGDLCYAYRTGVGSDALLPDEYQTRIVDPAVWDAWLAQIEPVAAAVPWMPTIGNHEMEPGYGLRGYGGFLGRFSLPSGGAATGDEPVVTYSFDYGNARFIALDANDANYEIPYNAGYLGSVQDAWLTERLASARAPGSGIDWIVVGYHQCSYCTNLLHASDAGLRDRWDALFARYQVDLVVNGHNHSYERAHPVVAGRLGPLDNVHVAELDPTTDGTTFITAGSGGNPRVERSAHPMSYVTMIGGLRVPELANWSASRYLNLSFISVDVTPRDGDGRATMTIRSLTPDRTEVDRVTLVRR